MVFAGVGDTLRAERTADISLTVDGPFASGLSADDDNLVVRAVRLVGRGGAARGAALGLTKMLPVASGIGGGSADAAAALRVMRRLWGLDQDLSGVALSLGADVPACLASRPARMRGIGERLEPAPLLPPCGIVLVNPGVAVATAEVFRARTGGFSPEASLPAGWSDVRALAGDLRAFGNDLQAPAIGVCPAIGSVLRVLADVPGCLLARMSGSGATCFGLFGSEVEAAAAAGAIRRPGWWCWGGGLHVGAPAG